MNGLGFLALGASAGMFTALIASRARTDIGSWLVALLPVLLSGAAVFLLPQLALKSSVDLYAVGLLVSLMWQQTGSAMRVLDQPSWLQNSLAIFSFVIALSLTIFALVLAFRN